MCQQNSVCSAEAPLEYVYFIGRFRWWFVDQLVRMVLADCRLDDVGVQLFGLDGGWLFFIDIECLEAVKSCALDGVLDVSAVCSFVVDVVW